MGDRVAVMRREVLQQLDEPQALYDAPANLFVASFIGSPPMNLLRGRVVAGAEGLACELGEQRLLVPDALVRARPALRRRAGKEVAVGIRSESLAEPAAPAGALTLRGVATVTEALGSERLVHLAVDGEPAVTTEVLDAAVDVDASARDELRTRAAQHRSTLVARFGPRSRVRAGDTTDVAVDTTALHFFDLETGLAL